MTFCPNCGVPVDGYVPAQPAEPMEITLARIAADRDVAVARLEASARRAELATEEHVAEVAADAVVEATEAEAASDVAAAEAVAGVIAAEGKPEPEPVIVEAPAPEPEPDDAPPLTEHHEPRAKKNGWFANYR
jgi:thioredoxin-like negative regulator of GroEL